MARVRKMRVSFDLVKGVLGQGSKSMAFVVISDGLPGDARLVSVEMAPLFPGFDIHIESESFKSSDDEFIQPVLKAVE